jgi:hypothetical protein
MGSGIGQLMARILPMAAGAALTPFIGPAGPIAGSLASAGLSGATASGLATALPGLVSGVGGGIGSALTQPKAPSLPSVSAPALTAAPMVAGGDLPSAQPQQLTLNPFGAGTPPSAGAGTGDYGNQIAANLFGPSNPFAQYAMAA